MFLLKRLVLAIIFFFPAANCFAGMVTSVQNETFSDNSSRQLRVLHLMKMEPNCLLVTNM